MSSPTETMLTFLSGSSYFWLLLAGCLLAVAVGRHAWRRAGSAETRDLMSGAASLLACFVGWATFSALFTWRGLPPSVWMAPFDRLFAVLSLVVLGWALAGNMGADRRWRRFLGAGLLATVLAYAAWAPLWAREFLAHPALVTHPTGMSRAWDVWQVAVAIAVGVAVLRRAPRPPRWMVGVLAGLLAASVLELVTPLSLVFPAWSRLGTLLAGTFLVGAAVSELADMHGSAVGSACRRRMGTIIPFTLARLHPRATGTPEAGPDLALDACGEGLTDQVLHTACGRLGAGPALVCLLTPGGDFDTRLLAGVGADPVQLRHLPLEDLPTLRQVLRDGRASLDLVRQAEDLHHLYDLAGVPAVGAVLLQRIGDTPPLGVVAVSRTRGQWEVRDQNELAAVARWAASAIVERAARRATRGDLARALTAIEAQSTAVTHLSRAVDTISERLGVLEASAPGDDPSGRGARPEVEPGHDAEEPAAPIGPDRAVPPGPDGQLAPTPTLRASLAVESLPVPAMGTDSAPSLEPAPATATGTATVRSLEPVPVMAMGTVTAPSLEPVPVMAAVPSIAPVPVMAAVAAPAAVPVASTGTIDLPVDASGDDCSSGRGPTAPEAADLGAITGRVPRYERALDRLPWGVVVVDAAGAVAFANAASGRLLHMHTVPVGAHLTAVLPDADRVELALHRARERARSTAAGATPAPIEIFFTSPAVRVELDPLCEPPAGFLGAVAIIHPDAAESPALDAGLVRAMSDALRAPMSMILGYSDLLSRGAGLTGEQLERFLQRIDANLARMQVMLGNLVTVLDLAGSTPATAPQAVDLGQGIQRAVARAQAQLVEKSLRVDVRVDGPLPLASGDPGDVNQLLDNLLVNAALRSPQGGDIVISAGVHREAGGATALQVIFHDRGAHLAGGGGIIEIDAAPGSPVGLTVVRLQSARMGGRAWAESDPLGARFLVRLPVRR